ncbi:inositol polyphosphate 1-phosphatase-like [Chanos chanos]|uniref:inositol-1,4-bisphosphate 1-phosphatase n=1 Tax=Chanos chanos TaxID=29144 RepID=A0A6J2V4T9_CHACN|nr:inositol polyphosphate 1-phosphatase [Chanos chanos]
MGELLRALVQVSEKAANIARYCRQDESLFSLLIQQKGEVERNKTFVTDFKTLADVLIQEVIKHDIGKQFSGLESRIFGEETNEFQNGLGEKIVVRICERREDTAQLLSTVLGGNVEAAELLAFAAHQEIIITDLQTDTFHIPIHKLGVWVDPIDSTAQYIKGIRDSVPRDGIYTQGLQCVTVLIGVYDLETGVPVMGVINQPFARFDSTTKRWTGQFFWGISSGPHNVNSLNPTLQDTEVRHSHAKPTSALQAAGISAVLSTGESEQVRTLFQENCAKGVHYAAGAGYKCLCVILGLADVYVFSEDSTYRWDCCSPHAILRSVGGGIVSLRECLRQRHAGKVEGQEELMYNAPTEGVSGVDKWVNKGGFIAFRSRSHLETVLNLLSTVTLL